MSLIESNSTKLKLIAGASFHGNPFKPSNEFITLQITATYRGGNSGLLEVFYSIDGIYYDTFGDSWTFTTDTEECNVFKETQIKGSYFYVKWTNNGSSEYTSFNLNTKLTKTTSSVSVDGVINIPTISVDINGQTVFSRLRDANNNDIGSYEGNLNVFDSYSNSLLNSLNNKLPSGLLVVDNKLKCDISGQRVISDVSGQTLNVNTISGFALDSTLTTTNTKLDTLNTTVTNKHLFFTNDSVTVGDISSGVQVGINNFPSFALDTTLVTTNNKLDTINTTITNKHLSKTLDSVDISGQRVITDISGQRVVTDISGQRVVTDISGQRVITDISGQRVDISGQRVITDISGQRVDISGQRVITDISGQSVNVNVISGFALDSTLTTTNSKLDTINTTITNKHLSKTLDSVDISGQTVIISGQMVMVDISGQRVDISGQWVDISGQRVITDISGQRVVTDISGQRVLTDISGQRVDISGQTVITDISGQTVVTDISGQRVDISGQSLNVNVISGFALDSTLTTTNTKLDTINTTITNKHLSKTTDSVDISGQRVDISGQTVVITNLPPLTVTTDISGQRVDISGETVNSNMYVSTNGTNWHHIKADANGVLNTHSMLQDGVGNDLTSKLIASSRALDVNIVNTVDPIIIDFANPTIDITGAVTVSNFPVTQGINGDVNITNTSIAVSGSVNANITNTSLPVTGTFWQSTQPISGSVNANITNTSLPVTGTFFQATQPISGNVGITGTPTINIQDSTGNSLTSTSSNLDVNMKAYNRTGATTTNLTTVQPVGASSSVKALETYSYLVGLNNSSNLPLQITSTTGDTSQNLDVQIQNGSTTNTTVSGYTATGLNTYQILPKIKSFAVAGFSNHNVTDVMLAGIGNTLTVNSYAWGKANANKSYWLYTPTGANVRSISYNYINALGNEATGTATGVVNSYVALQSNIVCLNNFTITGNVSPISTDALHITLLGSGTTTTAVANIVGIRTHTNNGIFTVPNNAIAMVTNIDSILSTANDVYYMNIWDADGNRTVAGAYYMYITGVNNYKAGAGDYGCIGRVLTAGETVAFTTVITTTVNRNIYANIKVIYF